MSGRLNFTKIEFFRILFTSVSIYLYMLMFEHAIAMIFVLNFAGEPNATIALGLLMANGFSFNLIFKRYWPLQQKWVGYIVGAATIFIGFSLIPLAVSSALTAVIAQVLLLPVLTYNLQQLREKISLAAILAIGYNVCLRIWFHSLSLFATPIGRGTIIAIAFLWVINWIYLNRQDAEENKVEVIIHLYPLMVLIYIEYFVLSSASLLSTWYLPSEELLGLSLFMVLKLKYTLMNVAILMGLLVGAYISINRAFISRQFFLICILVYWLAIIDIFYANKLVIISIFLVQMTASVFILTSSKFLFAKDISQFGMKLGLVQLLLIILMILELGAGNWAFFPG
ncbi:MAG: hypothetical protein ACW98K_07945, partial [Candidatus Kariarchaeaceae archaeon]